MWLYSYLLFCVILFAFYVLLFAFYVLWLFFMCSYLLFMCSYLIFLCLPVLTYFIFACIYTNTYVKVGFMSFMYLMLFAKCLIHVPTLNKIYFTCTLLYFTLCHWVLFLWKKSEMIDNYCTFRESKSEILQWHIH